VIEEQTAGIFHATARERIQPNAEEHASGVVDIRNAFTHWSRLATWIKDGDFFKVSVHALMGDNPHFETSQIVRRTPLDTNKVLYLNREQESLVLDPFIVLERCPGMQSTRGAALRPVFGKQNSISAMKVVTGRHWRTPVDCR